MDNLNFKEAAEKIIELSNTANAHTNDTAPWKLIKDETNIKLVQTELYAILETCRIIGLLLLPIVPNLSSKIIEQLGLKFEKIRLDWYYLILTDRGHHFYQPVYF